MEIEPPVFNTAAMCGENTSRGYNQVTASGRPFWSKKAYIEEIRIFDIAHALARLCRFNGALRPDIWHYSVAQHSCLVSDNCPDGYKLEGLLHDSTEGYFGDDIKPHKLMFRTHERDEVETCLDRTIRRRFGLPTSHMSACVKQQDAIAVVTERRDILPDCLRVDWGNNLPAPWTDTIEPWSAERSYNEFMDRFIKLYALGGVQHD